MLKLFIVGGLAVAAIAQEHVVVPLADTNRPVTMKVHILTGSITVRAYNGREVLVDVSGGSSKRSGPTTERGGLHRIEGAGTDVSIESENNIVSISQHMGRAANLVIQTPVNTSLNVKALSGGDIVVEGVNGDVEAQNLNGGVTLRNVAGTVVVHSLNGAVTVVMSRVTSGKAMSFTSLNGNIDVTLPADVRADFSMKTNCGEILSDFDVKVKSAAKPSVEESGGKSGKYRIRTESTVTGSVNGGGPEYTFSTFNGSIFIRKPK